MIWYDHSPHDKRFDPLIFQMGPLGWWRQMAKLIQIPLDMITCWPMTVSAADKPGDFFVSTVKDYLPYTCSFFLAITCSWSRPDFPKVLTMFPFCKNISKIGQVLCWYICISCTIQAWKYLLHTLDWRPGVKNLLLRIEMSTHNRKKWRRQLE